MSTNSCDGSKSNFRYANRRLTLSKEEVQISADKNENKGLISPKNNQVIDILKNFLKYPCLLLITINLDSIKELKISEMS